jgi:hypothetical protein
MNNNELKIAVKDKDTGAWSKWTNFYGGLSHQEYLTAYDIHRGMCYNEIVIESDYPDYYENYDAARIIGELIESKGFIPHYYYSGNKSVHIHVFLDFDSFLDINLILRESLLQKYKTKSAFMKSFMIWIRGKMIGCWDTGLRKFDTDLIKDTHLIRCEGSKNKLGFKTFLGYTFKDLSMIPYVCNEINRIYPSIGDIRLSKPHNMHDLVEEFIRDVESSTKIKRLKHKNMGLHEWLNPGELRGCIKYILCDDFKKFSDGYRRAAFILSNEIKKTLGAEQAVILVNEWNAKLGFPLTDKELMVILNNKVYSLSCDYVHKFLKSLGCNDIDEKCDGKIYK